MSRVVSTNIRLNLDREADRKAWEYLQHMDRKQYRSYSRAVVAALNDYFGRQERLEDDPYLETREKEDAFLQRVLDTVEKGLSASGASGLVGLAQLLQGAAAPPKQEALSAPDSEALDDALSIADSM